MAEQELFARVIKFIKPFVKNQDALAQASAETRILDDLGVNSARFVDIIIGIENEFNIELEDADVDKVDTIGDAVHAVEAKMAG
jgi:acyl carrier protein